MRSALALVLLAACNTPTLKPVAVRELVAHRGVHQTFPPEGVENDTCTATRIHPPTHPFLENTIASMREAFRLGATMVELDIHPTTDGQLVVFHDWTLDCRTNGTGVTHDQPLAYLKSLDIGYGYTADGGKTFPFRGKGVGLMPTLDEVLQTFPERQFLINQKDRSHETAKLLAAAVNRLPKEQRSRLFYWGPEEPYETLRALAPEVRELFGDVEKAKRCGYRYIGFGWLGVVPEACQGIGMRVPLRHANKLWGWPERFIERMQSVGTRVVVTEVNTVEEARAMWALPVDGILTDRIEVIGPAVGESRE